MIILFYGHSDDCVEIEVGGARVPLKKDELYAGPKDCDRCALGDVIRVETIGGSKGVNVRAVYDGCWSFAVGKTEEGRRLPGWKYEVGDKHEYSVGLVIDTGDDLVTVTHVKKDK